MKRQAPNWNELYELYQEMKISGGGEENTTEETETDRQVSYSMQTSPEPIQRRRPSKTRARVVRSGTGLDRGRRR